MGVRRVNDKNSCYKIISIPLITDYSRHGVDTVHCRLGTEAAAFPEKIQNKTPVQRRSRLLHFIR